jgi:hypothetical protein
MPPVPSGLMSEHTPIEAFCRAVESVADWLDQINQHIADQNFNEARSMIWKVVPMKQGIAEAKKNLPPLTDLPQSELAQWLPTLRTATQRLGAADSLLEECIHQVPLLTKSETDSKQIEELADYMLSENWNTAADVIVLVGRSCASLAEQLLKKGQQRVYCVVPDDVDTDDSQADYTMVHTGEELLAALQPLRGNPPEKAITQMVDAGCGSTDFVQEMSDLVYMEMLDFRAQLNTVDRFGKKWVANVLGNFADIPGAANIHHVGNHFEGKPFVVISTGPSLSKNIDQLAQLKGKAILVALNHSLSAMQKAGIMPDLAIALEAQDLTYHFQDFPVEGLAALAVSATVKNNLFQLPVKRFLSFSGDNLVDNWAFHCMNETAQLSSGGSVANNALSLALLWKCDPILFVGQDLALTNGEFYAKTCVDGGMAVEMSEGGKMFRTTNFSDGFKALDSIKGNESTPMTQTVEVPGYDGGTVFTTGPLNIYRRWFETVAKANNKTTRIWNCTEGGAYIDGMEHIPLSEAIQRLQGQSVDIEGTLDRVWDEIDWENRRQLMLDGGTALLNSVTRCVQLAKRCTTLAGKAQFNPGALQKLHQSERELIEQLQPIVFISQVQSKLIRETLQNISECTSMREMLNASKSLYRIVLEADDYLAKPLKEKLRKLSSSSN